MVLVGLSVFITHSGEAAEAFLWSPTFGAASLGTGQDEKPLLVIDLAGEVTSAPFTSPMGRLLMATTFSDPRVVELSRRRFQVVCRQHGVTPLVKWYTPKGKKESLDFGQSDNVIFYFCTPDARVLHMAVGFLPTDQLLAAANLAERLHREVQLERDVARQQQAVRSWHMTYADGKYLREFQRRWAEERHVSEVADAWDTDFVRDVVALASDVRTLELKTRLQDRLPGAALAGTIERLAHHGEVATSFAHLSLAEVPLVKLDTIDHICFEMSTGQPFLSITGRRQALYRWFTTAREQRQPIMLVVDDQPFKAPPVNELSNLLVWEPRSLELRKRLAAFACAQITPGELTALVHDASLPPMTLSSTSFNWLIFDRHGEYVDNVINENGTELLKTMERAVE